LALGADGSVVKSNMLILVMDLMDLMRAPMMEWLMSLGTWRWN
jgi:hypothetical protein